MDHTSSVRLADLVRLGMPALIAQHGTQLTAHQRQALHAITACRSGAFGTTVMACADCGFTQLRLRSCGHRSCPTCQHHTASDWLERQQAKLLPVDYFMATFTLPAALRPIAYRQPSVVYSALFSAAADTLKSFGLTQAKLHAELGFCAVLHTHSRRLDYHPHLHVVIPAGGVDAKHQQWRTLQGDYLFNGFALAKVFRAKCLHALVNAGVSLPASLPKQWVVHCKQVGRGLPAFKYLSRYLYRGVISERDLSHYDPVRETVTFRYRDAKTQRYQRRTLSIADFLWRIAIHVLPKGLQRVRHYGFLHGNAKRLFARLLVVLRIVPTEAAARDATAFLCPVCAAPMHIHAFIPAPSPSG